MEDVTNLVLHVLALAYFAIINFAKPSREKTAAALLLVLTIGVVMYVRIHLPISRDAEMAWVIANIMCWVALLAIMGRKSISETKAADCD